MSRRMTKIETKAIGFLAVIGAIVAGVAKFFEIFGFALPALAIALIIGWYFWQKSKKTKARLEYLRNKYKDETIVQKIVSGYFWQGQTAAQVLDSLGQAADIEQSVLKTKKKEVWKYRHQGSNRYGLRIILENNVVIGWDQKD